MAGAAIIVAALLLIGGAVLHPGRGGTPSAGGHVAVDPTVVSNDPTAVAIARTQARLRQEPGNWDLWSTLGSAYLQVGRITADPTYYPKAQAAFARSMALHTGDNVAAMAGLGQLAAARHDFAGALRWARRAQAIDAYNSVVYGVIADALTQLGDYPGARSAVQRMLDLKPGVAAFTRASYDLEIHGQPGSARDALTRALSDSLSPPDVGFCRYYLGELAFNSGDLREASAEYARGLQADPKSTQLLAGKARIEAFRGEQRAAIADYTTVTERVPLPQYVLEFGDYLSSIGQRSQASQQYVVVQTEQKLFTANGVIDDLLSAEFDADHGHPRSALTHARAEWNRRHSVLVADALAWALHVNGRDAEAIQYSRTATRLGWRNATFLYHRGMIENSLGRKGAAQADLAEALRINPNFSFLQTRVARRALASLVGKR